MEEVQVNLLVNQLAIIRILNETRASPVVPGFGVREVLEEVRKLQTNLATMHGDLVATLRENTVTSHHGPEPQSEVNEREIEQLKQILEALGDTVAAQGRKIEENGHETGQLKEILVILNGSVTSLASEVEAQKREIESTSTTVALECREEGKLHVNDDCSISVCSAGFLNPYQGSSAPNVSFSYLLAKDCIHLERITMSWSSARANCISLGGDLFVAGDFKGAGQYLEEQNEIGLAYWPWVGVKNRVWLDGRPVAAAEWNPGYPKKDPDECAYAIGDVLENSRCNNSWTSLCMKGTLYQES